MFCEIDAAKTIKALTPLEYLALHPENQVVAPCPSSWGDKGFYEVWLNEKNDWIYPHLHRMADTMTALADRHFQDADPLNNRVLNQMARELLLAQSSDWAFLITMGTAIEYSVKRTKEHIFNFNTLHGGFKSGRIDAALLEWIEYKNSIFGDIDFRVYARRSAE
jgi:1,4-alpha-glucan branching enzyme